jgi:hypothetical protein
MKQFLLALALVLSAAAAAGAVAAQQTAAEEKAADAIARIEKLLDTMIKTEGLQDPMPLPKFLVALAGRLPKGDRLTIRIDEKAFGEDAPLVVRSQVQLPALPKQMPLGAALRLILSQAENNEADYDVQPNGIVVTHPRGGARTTVYDAADVVGSLPQLLPTVIQTFRDRDLFHGVKPRDGTSLLIRLLANEARLEPWETVQIINGTRLTVFGTPATQRNTRGLLWSLRRMAGVGVVMNARLYEVDRAFFAKHVAPLLIGKEIPNGLIPHGTPLDERPLLVPVGGPLLNKITKYKHIMESDDIKIRPGQTTAFLARQTLFHFDAGVPLGKRNMVTRTGLAGVRFEVKPLENSDYGSLRLRITQSVTQLVAIGKGKRLDATTGAEQIIEVPAVRQTATTGKVQVLDGNPFLMPVDYQPPGKENAGKVWLLVARPVLWDETEEKAAHKAGTNKPPNSIWDRPPVSEEK